MIHGVYKEDGPDERLRLKGALLREDPTDDTMYLAQFDPMYLPEAHNWHPFKKSLFIVKEK